MAMAARPFGRRPREDQGAVTPAASLGAVLELLRALNWTIRADVPWPTERGQSFDFVLVGEPGVFGLWVHDGEPEGVEAAAAGLGALLDGARVRPVVCRGFASLGHAHPEVLYCTPETALDLLIGLPVYEDPAAIRAIATKLRDLEVPIPPEPSPAVEVAPPPAPKPAPAPPAAEPAPKPEPKPVTEAAPEPPRPLPAGRHRSERPRFARRSPPPPPAGPAPRTPKSTLELPTALAPTRGRARGGNEAARRFENGYVYVPEPVVGPGPLKREFRAKPFLTGLVVLIAIVFVAGLGVKAWPRVAGLIRPDANPSTVFGRTISVGITNFHPNLTLRVEHPQRVGAARGVDSYAVAVSVSNLGPTSWPLPPRRAFVLVDSLGESHALTTISGVASSRWAGSLKQSRTWSGRLIFTIRAGRTPLRLRFTLAANGSETATWHN